MVSLGTASMRQPWHTQHGCRQVTGVLSPQLQTAAANSSSTHPERRQMSISSRNKCFQNNEKNQGRKKLCLLLENLFTINTQREGLFEPITVQCLFPIPSNYDCVLSLPLEKPCIIQLTSPLEVSGRSGGVGGRGQWREGREREREDLSPPW